MKKEGYGFDYSAKAYTLKQFQNAANEFKRNYFDTSLKVRARARHTHFASNNISSKYPYRKSRRPSGA